MKNKKVILAVILVIAAAAAVYFLRNENGGGVVNQPSLLNLESQSKEVNGITLEVVPLDFNIQNPVKFGITVDTHSGSLGFDFTKISVLEDDFGNKYLPLEWQGPGLGGHHLSGILAFPKLIALPKELKLIIQDNPPRIFKWNL